MLDLRGEKDILLVSDSIDFTKNLILRVDGL
jgi:hypothetical protein